MPEQRLRFLADASILLASSLDLQATLQHLAREVVPRFADWCTIAVLDDEGVMRRIAGHHADPMKAAAMDAYLAGFPPERHRASPMISTVHGGASFFEPNVTDAILSATAQDQAHLAILRELGCTATIVAPLLVRGESIGAFSMCMSGERTFDDLDHQLARELGALTGLAVDNARRFDAERNARERAERAEAAKDEFLAMLGHELRNPLAPIVSAIDLLKLRNAAPARELGVIERQTKHLVRLVDDLLDVSRIARGLVTLARQRVETGEVVQRAVEMTEALISARQQKLTVTVPPGLVLDADPERIAQVLTNLLTNAAKYTPADGTIELTAHADGDMVVLLVRDSGVGIAPDMLPHVFEMFVQQRQALDRPGGGLGLGLTIVKSIVEAHGGHIEVRSAGQGRGSEFELRLPAARGKADPLLAEARPPISVLVVDDNEDAAMLMADSLERAGYTTRVAHDAGEAIAAVREWHPRAAILDIGLPVIDGYELARRLRAQPGLDRLFLVALTGYGQASDRERALAAGFDHHLVKPVTSAAIRAVLDAIPAPP